MWISEWLYVTQYSNPDAQYSNRVVYCPKHLPKLINLNGTILEKKRLKQSQDITIN